MHRQTTLLSALVPSLLLLPTTAYAHAGGLEFFAPAASAALGLVLGFLSFRLPKSRRFYVPMVVAVLVIVATLWSMLLHEPTASIGTLSNAVVFASALLLAPFAGAFVFVHLAVPAVGRLVATWRRVKEITRPDQ